MQELWKEYAQPVMGRVKVSEASAEWQSGIRIQTNWLKNREMTEEIKSEIPAYL